MKRKDILNKSKGILKTKEIEAKMNQQLAEMSRKNRPKRGEFLADLWNDKHGK